MTSKQQINRTHTHTTRHVIKDGWASGARDGLYELYVNGGVAALSQTVSSCRVLPADETPSTDRRAVNTGRPREQ